MVIRAVSQLTQINSNQLNDTSSTYLEISYPNSNKQNTYVSRKISVYDLNKKNSEVLSTNMCEDHDMLDEYGTPISISSCAKNISILSSEDCCLSGVKIFEEYPLISSDFPSNLLKYGGEIDNVVPNVKKVKELVGQTPAFVSTTSSMVADGCPFKNLAGQIITTDPSIRYQEFETGENFYMWNIESGKKDSSQTSLDSMSKTTEGYIRIRDTGYLTIWGWLADNDQVAADLAWVGLFARMKCQGYDNTVFEVPLQIRPWIQGSKSQEMQYVGFNVPVREGLELKIKTGFPVKGGSTGAHQQNGSMTFRSGWIPNSFVGYVIKSM